DNYNLRMTDYLNLSGATATNITQTYYIKAAADAEAADPTETDYDFKLSDSEPGYLNDILGGLTGTTALNYKGVCVYYKNGEAVYTSPVLSGAYNFELTPMLVFSNEYDETDVLYYPCRLSARVIYGGNYDTVYYGIGKVGSLNSTEGWSNAGESFEVSGDINADDVALYAVLYDSKNNVGYTGDDGNLVIFEKPLIRVGDTTISGDGDDPSATITLESTGVPQNFTSDIYYTLDGSDPTDNGTLYTGPISTAKYATGDVVTVKAYTQLSNGDKSIEGEIAERDITVTDAAPVITCADGVLTITNDGGRIYYTLDGSDPRTSSTKKRFTAPVSLGGLNKLVRAVTYNDGNYSAVSEVYADGGAYDLGTVTLPYSTFSEPVEFYASELEDDDGEYWENEQEFTFTITEPGTVSFDMFFENIVEDGYSGYYIYRPQLYNAEGEWVFGFYGYDVDEYRHYYRNELLPAGTYSIVIEPDWGEVYRVKLKNLKIDRADKIFFSGANDDMGERYISDRGYYLYLDRLDYDSVVYYNLTTDGSEPDAPTLDSAAETSGSSIVYVGREKPVVRVKAAVYNAETGTLGTVYSGYFTYAGAFDIYAVDGKGNRTSVGWETLDGTNYDVIYDYTGKLYIDNPSLENIFPDGVDDVQYYYTVSDGTSIFDNGTVYERAREYTPGQVTLADLAEAADKDDYHQNWGFDVRAGAIVTSGGKVYYIRSDNRGYLYSMPAQPVTTVNGNTITLTTQSEGAKLYYSTKYNIYFGEADRYYTEYTGPIEFDRNLIFTPVAVWDSSKNNSGMHSGFSTTGRQFIPSTVIKSYTFEESPDPGRESAEYFVPLSVENPQSVDITVPAGQKYYFHYLRTMKDNYFDSECEVYAELQKLVDGSYVTVNDNFYNVPFYSGLWYDYGPFLTAGSWRLTFKAVPGSEAGQKSLVFLKVHCENNADDFTYPRLGGLVVTPRIDGMLVDVNNITIPQTTIDELYTYITVNKGKSIELITGSADATEADAKAVIRAYLEDKNNYDYVKFNRRERNSDRDSGEKTIRSSDNWVYLDPSDDMEANTEYTYYAEIYLKSEWGKWTYGVFDRHGNAGWYRTDVSASLYVLLEDDEDPEITDFYFLQAGDVEVENISKACTIFVKATDNQRVKYYNLEYKLSSDGDDKYRSIHSNTDIKTKSFSTYKTLRYEDLVPGNEYTFRCTIKDSNGNTVVRTFTVYCEDIPDPTDFTVTQASSSVIINWTPQKGYAYRFEFYTENNERITSTRDWRYDDTRDDNGNVKVYIDPVTYPTFFIRQRQWAVDQYDIELAYVEKHNLSDGEDTEAPVITGMWPHNNSNGGYGNRYSEIQAWDDNRLYSVEFAFYTRTGEEGNYVYTLAEGFPAPETYYFSPVDIRFNNVRPYYINYDCRDVVPGTYYMGTRATDTAGNTSDWSYSQFKVTEEETKRTPLPPLNVTAGTDRFYIAFTPVYDEYMRQNIYDAFISYWVPNGVDLTEEMIDDFLDHILDYAKVEFYYYRYDRSWGVNITDKIVNGEFTYVYNNGDKTAIAGNISWDSDWPYPDRYYGFCAKMGVDNTKELTNWQHDLLAGGSDYVWVCTLTSKPIKLLDDAEAPWISDIINTSGTVNVDNSSV
ncbi:MAG: FN3 associated domain-containing protein, partial [Eubacteriales bacterium]|nr:FN3 associated domain-containing protein [Eubacteriales bacterium]